MLRRLSIGLALVVAIAFFVPPSAADRPETTPYLVGFEGGLPEEVTENGRFLGRSVVRTDAALGFAVVEVPDPAAFAARAEGDPRVRYVKYDDPNAYSAHFTPNDPRYGDQYGWGRVQAPAAWDTTRGSASVVVAVLDTGLYKAHEDFDASRILQGHDFANGDSDPNDDCGHGTHVAGTVGAATNNGVGVAGGAETSILPVKVLKKGGMFGGCSGSFSSVASGIRYSADQGADVISMSLGCDGCFDQATADAIEYAWNKGTLIVASAGNSGPCANCVGFPANHDKVMAVAATDQSDAKASFSSSGPQVEIAAPGKDILSTTPSNGYKKYSGTSMSAPHVSAAAALALAVAPSLTNSELRGLIQSTAKDLGPTGRDSDTGYGLVDYAALVSAAGGGSGGGGGETYTNAAPTASFTYSCSGLSCAFDGTGSSDSDGTIVSYEWTFGDTASATGATVEHTYAAGGTYAVTLKVTDNGTAIDTQEQSVFVSDPNAPASTAHVGDITGWFDHYGRGFHRVYWTVPVLDASGAAVPDATVEVRVRTPDAGASTGSGTTGADGTVTFRFDDKAILHGDFTLCVTNVAKSGWQYDAAANVETCQIVTTT